MVLSNRTFADQGPRCGVESTEIHNKLEELTYKYLILYACVLTGAIGLLQAWCFNKNLRFVITSFRVRRTKTPGSVIRG